MSVPRDARGLIDPVAAAEQDSRRRRAREDNVPVRDVPATAYEMVSEQRDAALKENEILRHMLAIMIGENKLLTITGSELKRQRTEGIIKLETYYRPDDDTYIFTAKGVTNG